MCRTPVERPAYWAKFLKAWDARKLAPRLEEMIWHYAYGKPAQAADLGVTFDHVAYLAANAEERRLVQRIQ